MRVSVRDVFHRRIHQHDYRVEFVRAILFFMDGCRPFPCFLDVDVLPADGDLPPSGPAGDPSEPLNDAFRQSDFAWTGRGVLWVLAIALKWDFPGVNNFHSGTVWLPSKIFCVSFVYVDDADLGLALGGHDHWMHFGCGRCCRSL